MPSVARLAARTGPVRAITGPLTHGTFRRPTRRPDRAWAQNHTHTRHPHDAGKTSTNPPVVQTGAVDANQRAHPRPLRYLMVPYAGAFPQRQPQALPTAPPLPSSPR